ncbi:MAG: histidine kinase, partial [Nitrospirae bacterium]|nr:histidine kinase [Nitrospirota bacterium]
NANKVTVFMYNNDNGLVVKVVDDGVGIERQKVFDHNSLGLMGMRERVALFGWQMEIKGKTNKGTVVKLLIPGSSIEQ